MEAIYGVIIIVFSLGILTVVLWVCINRLIWEVSNEEQAFWNWLLKRNRNV